jgi:hypothetical protein
MFRILTAGDVLIRTYAAPAPLLFAGIPAVIADDELPTADADAESLS